MSLETTFPDQHGVNHPAVWRDKAGVIHKAVGADAGLPMERVRLMWTACGEKDIPANAAWLQTSDDEVTCENCLGDICPKCGGTLKHGSVCADCKHQVN